VLSPISLYRHAVASTPVGPWGEDVSLTYPMTAAFPETSAGRLPRRTFRGLLGVHSRYGLPARRIAKTILSIEGFSDAVAGTAAPIATGWSDPLPGGNCTH
jgi:hypothetical protein